MKLNDDKSSFWSADQFERKVLAEDLLAFIESYGECQEVYGEPKSLVIGVDAPYGIGKTFFLKELQRAESESRAVAYVDAWADDIVNDPLVSVAATIRDAIAPWLDDQSIKSKWDDTAKKAGKIAVLATKGVAKQALKLAISETAVTGIEAVIDSADEDLVESIGDAAASTTDDVINDSAAMQSLGQNSYLERKICELNEIRDAIGSLRESLEALASKLKEKGLKTPIIIIVDELDRCRPNYAIRMLEEIKHIFSCPNVCFLLGINSKQLSRAMSAEYGANFDGAGYLDRFIDRYFSLPYPDIYTFVSQQWNSLQKGTAKELWFPQTTRSLDDRTALNHSQWLTSLLGHYEISPRHTFKFFDRLRTSIALSGGGELLMPYLAELIAIKVSGSGAKDGRPWAFYLPSFMGQGEFVSGDAFYSNTTYILDQDERSRRKSLDQEQPLNGILADFVFRQKGLGPQDYRQLLDRVGQFSFDSD